MTHLDKPSLFDRLRFMARWISHNPSPEPPVLAQTRIAGWWPTTYYFVTTFEDRRATGDEPLKILIRSLPGSNPKDCFVTLVYKVKRAGFPRYDDPYHVREYLDKQAAAAGHDETVRLLASGRLPLKRIHFGFND